MCVLYSIAAHITTQVPKLNVLPRKDPLTPLARSTGALPYISEDYGGLLASAVYGKA